MKRMPLSLAVAGFFTFAALASGQAPPALDRVLDLASAIDVFHGVAIAPDGRHVAWVESLIGTAGRSAEKTGIWVAPLDASGAAGTPRRITAKASPQGAAEDSPAWSPDGRRLAFLSDAGEEGQAQLWVMEAVGEAPGKPRRLTQLSGHLADPRWSADGRSIAFLYIEGKKGKAGPLAPTARDAGVVGEDPEVQRIALADAGTGTSPTQADVRLVSPADLFVYEYDLSPDGVTFAATAAPPPGDANWWTARIWAIPADGSAPRPLYQPRLQVASPRWSPDGRAIAFIEGLMSDFGVNGGDLHVLAAAGGGARNVTPGLPASPSAFAWTSPERILFAENVDGETGIAAVDLPTGRIETLWRGPELLTAESIPGLSLARDGRTSAVVRHSFGRPPEVWAGPIGEWRQVTRANAGLAPAWGPARSIHWPSDGATVQGWLLAPPHREGAAEGERHPLIVIVHGGPSTAHRPGWPTIAGALASQGFYVLLPNPRGSYGWGAAFAQGNVKDLGHGDLRDILAGVDAAAAAVPVDPERVGIYGWSYGGFMVMWAVTQTGRFKAAVAGAGIANWQSYYGQNRIDTWMLPFFGASVYDDPYIYARSSPILAIKNVRTPTLLLQGERDAEVPAPQSYEFWKGLKAHGVETQLVIYPDQGHSLKPESQRDRVRRLVDWMAKHLR